MLQEIPKPEFRKISDVVWEIQPSYKKGMLVPARIYATEKLLKSMDLGVYNQVTNVAALPGILKYAFCMPDGHWGYGFPIGGVAAFDAENGVISPGGIGFDINCMHPETRILLKHGCYKKIKDLDRNFAGHLVSFMDLAKKDKKYANISLFLKKKPDCSVFKISTMCGEELILTEDHPIYNGKEMVKAGELKENSSVVIHPFEGVEHETPSSETIIDEKDIIKVAGNRPKLIRTLRNKGLMPLRADSDTLPVLAKLLGFLTGDGWLGKYYNSKRKQNVWSIRAIGKLEDLEEIKKDINSLGYNIGYIKTQHYESEIERTDGKKRRISGYSSKLFIVSQSFAVLMKALGMPEGNKSRVAVSVPSWIKKSPLWIKRLYLAGLFGAEMTIPYQRKGENFGFTEPTFSQNKIASLEKDNERFLIEISGMLSEFGVNINKIYRLKGVRNSKGEETIKLSLKISAKTENLINLWSRVGYEYCRERTHRSMLALAYLKKKRRLLEKVQGFVEEARDAAGNTAESEAICALAEEHGISKALIRAQVSRKSRSVRIPSSFPTFKEFILENSIGGSEFVTDRIESIEEIEYGGYVYDFTMNDVNHNFIANCIVSHNCGMRLILTNLTYSDVKPHLKKLVDNLFERVPAGVGSSGFLKISKQEFKTVVQEGAKWCVENGYGWDEDLERSELGGKMEGADVDKISSKSIERGYNQIGTLGSGNHYLELQHVKKEHIYDEKLAKKWGLFPDQIVIMFHCGSRGFGHQIGTDYLQTFLQVMESKYKIRILDRELACAPFNSREGQDYFSAMKCGVNMSFANRQVILHRIREVFSKVLGRPAEDLGLRMVFDVAHNRASLEKHKVDGKTMEIIVHRKGATGSYPVGRPEIPSLYKDDGSPVIIGGSMETGSYLLVGGEKAHETFCSTAHGSGRTMSRTKAKGMVRGDKLVQDLEKRGIYVRTVSFAGVAEEAGFAYKDIDEVIEATHRAGISRKVVRFLPIGNVKG